MNNPKHLLVIIAIGIVSWALSGCASAPGSVQLPSETISPGTEESTRMIPIIGTAVEGGSQGGAQPTRTAVIQVDGVKIITQADQGATFSFRSGEKFMLILDEGFEWEIQISNPQVVGPVIDQQTVKGSERVYETLQSGQTELNASGDPLCRNERPACMRPSILFNVSIIVE